MPPLFFLLIMIVATGVAYAVHKSHRHRTKAGFRALAAQLGMKYSPTDLFNLRQRLVNDPALASTADLRVLDLVYATQEDRYRYLFTAEFTVGSVDHHKRHRRAATFCDPMDVTKAPPSPLLMAPEKLDLIEQYRHLAREWEAGAGKQM